jgi:hypothetical protein
VAGHPCQRRSMRWILDGYVEDPIILGAARALD